MIVKQHRNAMQTLVELLPEIERMGNREAVRWSNGFRTWIATYRELYGKIGAVVNDFDRRGIRKGDRVLIWGENRLEWMAVFWASVARGSQAAPVDYRFSPDLVQRISRESQPKLVIDNAGLDAIAALAPAMRFTPSEITAGDVVEI